LAYEFFDYLGHIARRLYHGWRLNEFRHSTASFLEQNSGRSATSRDLALFISLESLFKCHSSKARHSCKNGNPAITKPSGSRIESRKTSKDI
jgi:hypothetical protein